MISLDAAAFLALVILLLGLVWANRKKMSFSRFTIFYVAMYRGKTGLAFMDNLAKKYCGFWKAISTVIIIIGFLGMALVVFDLARSLFIMLAGAGGTSGVGIVAPFRAKGVFYVPFFYWIISIFGILIIHEGMHGVMARVYNLPVKNSGLMILGAVIPLIPGAFVEPDEKKLSKAPKKQQLAVYAAGPVSNIVTGLLLMALFTGLVAPYADTFYANDGVIVKEFMDGNPPAQQAGLHIGEKITEINGQEISKTNDFTEAFSNARPGDRISVVTTMAVYEVQLGENPQNQRAWFGTFVDRPLKSETRFIFIVLWLKDLLFWFALLSIGIGLFNLVPLGPIDGGRMLLTALEHVNFKKVRAATIWKGVSFFLLGILLTNVVLAFL